MSTGVPFDFDEDDDRPRRRRRNNDDDDRPRHRRRSFRNDEVDDFDDFVPRRRSGGDGLGITAMILGIGSLVIDLISPFGACICPFVFAGVILGLVLGIVAVILGFAARSKISSGMGLAGVITGFIGIAIALAMIILVVVGVGIFALNAPPPNNPPGGNPNFGPPAKRF